MTELSHQPWPTRASALAAAAMPAHQACAVSDDSELVKLEELIFEQHEKAAHIRFVPRPDSDGIAAKLMGSASL